MADDGNSSDKDQGLLTTVAESIGSALGNLAAKASAAQKSIGESTTAAVRKVTSKSLIRDRDAITNVLMSNFVSEACSASDAEPKENHN